MKKLEINCGTCDATGLTEEMLTGYDAVEINCGTLFVSPTAQTALLSRAAELNTGTVINAPEGTRLVTKMGGFTLTPGDVQDKPVFLMVMGSLILEPGAGAAAESYTGIKVMGSLIAQRSDRSPKIDVLGGERIYPDGYLYMEGDLTLDRIFRIRYAGKHVYTQGTVTVGAPEEFPKLLETGTKVLCGKLVVTEELLEETLKVAEPENPQNLVVIPDGFMYLEGKQKLTKKDIRRGKKLWIGGDMLLERKNAEVLSELEALRVTGKAVIPEECEERFEDLDPDCERVLTYRGTLIWGEDDAMVTSELLKREGFITVINCDSVILDKGLTPEEIEAGLKVVNCDEVICAPEQEDAARRISEDVDEICVEGPEEEKHEEPAPEGERPDVTEINCGTYKF